MSKERVVIAGALAQKPGQAGHTWVFLQYLLGFRQLGWDVTFVDRLEPEMCLDADGRACEVERSVNIAYLDRVMRAFGLERRYAVLCDGGSRCIGLSRSELRTAVAEAAFLINVNGFLDDEQLLSASPLKVFLDIDPGFGQMWRELGLHDWFAGHDAYVTVGENVGDADCSIPTCGLPWITTPQPIVLDEWPPQPEEGTRFTSVGSWRGPYGPLEFEGRTYGLRVHEFRKFFELPRLSPDRFEIALDIEAADSADLESLERNGWLLVDPAAVAADPDSYRSYVQSSKAEFMVAKSMYVESNSGWFSDRSICYLASGKPVLAQDTGFTQRYPTGAGLIAFSNVDEALAGVEQIRAQHRRHSRAARDLVEEHFDARKVLKRLAELVSAVPARPRGTIDARGRQTIG